MQLHDAKYNQHTNGVHLTRYKSLTLTAFLTRRHVAAIFRHFRRHGGSQNEARFPPNTERKHP